jgi:hypothetical protein
VQKKRERMGIEQVSFPAEKRKVSPKAAQIQAQIAPILPILTLAWPAW